MTARLLVSLLVLSLLAAPLAGAQQAGRAWRIGLLGLGTPPACESDIAPPLLALRRGLDDLGYVEGANFVFVTRCPPSVADAMPSARALAALNPDVVVTWSNTMVSFESIRIAAKQHLGLDYNDLGIADNFVDTKSVWLTANDTTRRLRAGLCLAARRRLRILAALARPIGTAHLTRTRSSFRRKRSISHGGHPRVAPSPLKPW